MRQYIAQSELHILLGHRKELLLDGRDLIYDDQNRIKELRKFLDSLEEQEGLDIKHGGSVNKAAAETLPY